MSSPPPSNILADPATELRAALASHAFGIASWELCPAPASAGGACGPGSHTGGPALSGCGHGHGEGQGHGAAARVCLLDGGEVVVRLDTRGYTIEQTPTPQPPFESLDALLIALSPAYAAAMRAELTRRFAEGPGERRWDAREDADEPEWID